MKALELLKNGENLLLVDAIESKKMQNTADTLNNLLREMNEQINSFATFSASQLDGEYSDKIVVAKSLAKFFEGNKTLKVESTVLQLENEEKAHMNEYYQTKTKLLDTIRSIIKDSSKEAVVSNYDIFEGEFSRCESGHEIIILNGRNVGVLETLFEELDRDLVISGNFSQVEPQEVDYSLTVLNRNIELCERKNNEIYGSKIGKLNKITSIIEKLKEVGEKVVAFYSYKNSLELIGCNPKGIKDYENELSRAYVPLKKALQKELKIDLEDICEVSINEEEYETLAIDEENVSPLSNMSGYEGNSYQESPASPFENVSVESAQTQNPFENTQNVYHENDATPSFEAPIENNPFENTQNTEQINPFENVQRENPFERDTTSNPFENVSTQSPFEDSNEPSPFENTSTQNPFENVSTQNPFDMARPNPFENNNNSNPFDN